MHFWVKFHQNSRLQCSRGTRTRRGRSSGWRSSRASAPASSSPRRWRTWCPRSLTSSATTSSTEYRDEKNDFPSCAFYKLVTETLEGAWNSRTAGESRNLRGINSPYRFNLARTNNRTWSQLGYHAAGGHWPASGRNPRPPRVLHDLHCGGGGSPRDGLVLRQVLVKGEFSIRL